jgi:hypothetical protein
VPLNWRAKLAEPKPIDVSGSVNLALQTPVPLNWRAKLAEPKPIDVSGSGNLRPPNTCAPQLEGEAG